MPKFKYRAAEYLSCVINFDDGVHKTRELAEFLYLANLFHPNANYFVDFCATQTLEPF